MSLVVAPTFQLGTDVGIGQWEWILAWGEALPGEAHVARVAAVRDRAAAGGVSIAMVIDFKAEIPRDQERAVFAPWSVMERPAAFVHLAEIELSDYPARYVIALELDELADRAGHRKEN